MQRPCGVKHPRLCCLPARWSHKLRRDSDFHYLNEYPLANALAMILSHRRGDAIGKVAQALTQCHHPQAFALSTPVQQGVELRA
jgi:hypothetical protein